MSKDKIGIIVLSQGGFPAKIIPASMWLRRKSDKFEAELIDVPIKDWNEGKITTANVQSYIKAYYND